MTCTGQLLIQTTDSADSPRVAFPEMTLPLKSVSF